MLWAVLAAVAGVWLLVTRPKQTLRVIAVSLVIAAIGVLWVWHVNDQYREKSSAEDAQRAKEAEAEAARAERIHISVSFDKQAADPGRPLRVAVTNSGDWTLSKVTWQFAAFKRGHSSDLVPHDYRSEGSDKILQPGETWTGYYELPPLWGYKWPEAQATDPDAIIPAELNWSAVAKHITQWPESNSVKP